MSVLARKHVLIVGNESSQVHDIASSLEREGATIHHAKCDVVTPESVEELKIDLIFLNHLHENDHCSEFLIKANQRKNTKVIPIFVLVSEEESKIEQALAHGAADYFTPGETVASILSKVRIVMGEEVNSASNLVIDISGEQVTTSGSSVKVLVVEDDPLLANLLSIRFERSGFPYHVNATGQNITKDLDAFQPDVVVLDLMLPGCSGFEVLEEVRNHKNSKNIPVFIFSNRDSAEDKKKATDLGASGFYVKAMTDLSELIQNITKAVQKSK